MVILNDANKINTFMLICAWKSCPLPYIFTILKFEDSKCKHGLPYWISVCHIGFFVVLTTGNLGRGYGS